MESIGADFEYDRTKLLGKGAWGAVFVGNQVSLNRPVAIKILKKELTSDPDFVRSFRREAECLAKMTESHIVQVYSAGQQDESHYFIMELVQGVPLSKFMEKRHPFTVEEIVYVAASVAQALKSAWNSPAKIVHRDIKPANLMWDPETDNLKITDFGIARITDSSKTKTGMVLGTHSYMSPEQLAGKKVSGQSDLFSLGVMLFQMVTGQLPFAGDSMAALMYKIANEDHPTPESINPKLPRCVGIVIKRALQKDVEKRYQTGKHMADDIGKCLKIIAAEGKV